MQYLAYFIFDYETGIETGLEHGIMNCMVEADDIEEALEKLYKLTIDLKKSEDALSDIDELFLDCVVEIQKIPESGFMVHYASWSYNGQGCITTSLQGVDDSVASAYGTVSDDTDSGDESCEKPFVDFREI